MAAARENLDPVLPRPLVETAIEGAKGTADFIFNDVVRWPSPVCRIPRSKTQFLAAMNPAVAEIRAYADWLKTEKLPKADNSYAVGRAGFVEMLGTEFIGLTPGTNPHRRHAGIDCRTTTFCGCRQRHRSHEITGLGGSLQIDSKGPSDRGGLDPGCAPGPGEHSQIRGRPSYHHHSQFRPRTRRGNASALSSHVVCVDGHPVGPFENKATEAYYYITPVESEWPPEQAEEWLFRLQLLRSRCDQHS